MKKDGCAADTCTVGGWGADNAADGKLEMSTSCEMREAINACADPTYSPRTPKLLIELTSRCNLRCVYCSKSSTGAPAGEDVGEELLGRVLDEVQGRNVSAVTANGHGETTVHPAWGSVLERFMAAGLVTGMISNLAKRFSDEEIDTLSHLDCLEISCDTVDPVLFAQLCRGAKLDAVLSTMARIREHVSHTGSSGPVLSWSSVVCDLTISGLPRLVECGLSRGVRRFNFNDLHTYSMPPGTLRVKPIRDLPADRMMDVLTVIRETARIAENGGAEVSLQSRLVDSAVRKLNGSSTGCGVAPAGDSLRRDAGRTRDCLEPWSFAAVRTSGAVRPCCTPDSPIIGHFRDGTTFEEILNGSRVRSLRRSLLDGDLPEYCRHCPARPMTSTEKLRRKVEKFVSAVPAAVEESTGPV